jgi:hypothetical protein
VSADDALPSRAAADVELRHGYTLDQLRGLSICTVVHCHHQGLADFGERPEVAWHAIVEHLYTSPQPSPPGAGSVFGSYRVEAFFSSWSPPMASAPGRVRQVMASTSS